MATSLKKGRKSQWVISIVTHTLSLVITIIIVVIIRVLVVISGLLLLLDRLV